MIAYTLLNKNFFFNITLKEHPKNAVGCLQLNNNNGYKIIIDISMRYYYNTCNII